MGLQKSVFASGAEKRNYEKLLRQWGDKYCLYHNLPFLNVFNTENLVDDSDRHHLRSIAISNLEWSRLTRTSIDYTLCDSSDHPLVCVEFDGLQDGFNVGTSYHTAQPSRPWRKIITELKLKVALGSRFPFFVVGYEHFEELGKTTQLTMVDGIIGTVLASNAAQRRFERGFDPTKFGFTQEEFGRLPKSRQHEIQQDWVIDVESWTACVHNPILEANHTLIQQLGVNSWTKKPVGDSYAPPTALTFSVEVSVRSTSGLEAAGKVMLPNFKTQVALYSLVEDLAKLVALERLKRKFEASGSTGALLPVTDPSIEDRPTR